MEEYILLSYFTWPYSEEIAFSLKKDFGHLNHVKAVKGYKSFEVGESIFCIAIWPGAYKEQGVIYGVWDENDHQRHIYLNNWSPVRETVWEGLKM